MADRDEPQASATATDNARDDERNDWLESDAEMEEIEQELLGIFLKEEIMRRAVPTAF